MSPKSVGAHVLGCTSNPKYEEYKLKRQLAIDKKTEQKEKNQKKFVVSCCKCSIEMEVIENVCEFPKKKAYYCSRSCANSHAVSDEQKAKVSNTLKQKVLESNRKKCKLCGNEILFKTRKIFCSDSCKNTYGVPQGIRDKISNAVKGKTGGWRNFGGNGKSGIFQGIVFQSSWELAWLIYQFDHGKIPTRCSTIIPYTNELGKESKYYPDFLLDNMVYEIKGFWSAKTQRKLDAAEKNGVNITLVDKDGIKPYLKYCIDSYGKDFWKQYEYTPG